jgi:hypothetical protein
MLWLLPWLKTYWEPWRYSALPGDARAAALEQRDEICGTRPSTSALLGTAAALF